jgi:uncharacterized protein
MRMPTIPHFSEILAERLARREFLVAGAAAALAGCGGGGGAADPAPPPPQQAPPTPTVQPLNFASVAANTGNDVTVPAGYSARTLIAWGDPIHTGVARAFDRTTVTRADMEQRFGVSNDMLALFPAQWAYPWPAQSTGGVILCANHEFTDTALQLGPLATNPAIVLARMDMIFASMGVSILRIETDASGALLTPALEPSSPTAINRRITPFTLVEFDDPVRTHPWIQSAAGAFNLGVASPGAAIACGTLANCAGGYTPWGTYLTAEENFQGYVYASSTTASASVPRALQQDAASFGYGFSANGGPGLAPYDLFRNPTAASVYGWIVEIDPYDPSWRPRKRAALGRRKAECATCVLAGDNRAVVYSADDQTDEFIYKFISTARFNAANRTANRDMLSAGKLYVARFDADGSGRWIELALAAANALEPDPALKFADEADLLVRARHAARLLGATPMDRPEDIEAVRGADFKGAGRVLVSLTRSTVVKAATPANPRRLTPGQTTAPNPPGHILEIREDSGDFAALSFRWDIFLLAGDPVQQDPLATVPGYGLVNLSVWNAGSQTMQGDRFAGPDNLALDGAGNLFIATDGSPGVFANCNDQVLATALDAAAPRTVKRFLVGPAGCEICGPLVTPDRRAFLCAIQHPGGATGFPDGPGTVARPAVVVVTRNDRGFIGD